MQTEIKSKKIHHAEDCPITATIDVIGGKWKPPIIWLLMKEGTLRFGELNRIMPGIALKVLSRSLKELEAAGIVSRTVYPSVPPKVEYALTEKGESLREIMYQLSEWSRKNILSEAEAI